MASPSVSGLTSVFDVTDTAATLLYGLDATPTLVYVSGSDSLEIRSITGNANEDKYIELPLTSAQDLSEKILVLAYGSNLVGNTYARVGLRSGATSNTNYVTYNCYLSGNSGNEILVALDGSTTADNSAGSFDQTDVQAIRFEFRRTSSNSNRTLEIYSDPFVVPSGTGAVLTGGDSGDPIDMGFAAQYFRSDGRYYSQTISQSGTEGFENFQQLVVPFSFGNGSTASTYIISGSAVSYASNTKPASNSGNQPTIQVAARTYRINTEASNVFLGLTVDGRSVDSFIDASSSTNRYPAFLGKRLTSLDLGNSSYSGVVDNSGIVEGGADVTLEFNNPTGTYAYNWKNSADLSGSEFANSPDFFINFDGANFTDGATFDATEITFSGTPGTKHFRVDASGKTLNITVPAGSGLTLADVTVVAGTVNVSAPAATTTISGVPTTANANSVVPAPAIGFYDGSDDSFIAALDTADADYNGDGSWTVVLTDYLSSGTIKISAEALGWYRTPFFSVDLSDPPSQLSIDSGFEEILSEDSVALAGLGVSAAIARLDYDQANARFTVAPGGLDFSSAVDKFDSLTSGKAGLQNFSTAVVRGIRFILNKYGREIRLPAPLTAAAAEDAATSPVLTDFLVLRAGDPAADLFEHGLPSTAAGLTDRPEIRVQSTRFITGSESGALTPAQEAQLTAIDTRSARVDGLIEDDSGDQFTAKALSQGSSGNTQPVIR